MEDFKSAFSGKQTMRNFLAIFWSVFASGYIIATTFREIPTENIRIVDTTHGFILGTIIAGIMMFFFGSSKGSEDKTEMMNKDKG